MDVAEFHGDLKTIEGILTSAGQRRGTAANDRVLAWLGSNHRRPTPVTELEGKHARREAIPFCPTRRNPVFWGETVNGSHDARWVDSELPAICIVGGYYDLFGCCVYVCVWLDGIEIRSSHCGDMHDLLHNATAHGYWSLDKLNLSLYTMMGNGKSKNKSCCKTSQSAMKTTGNRKVKSSVDLF